MNTVYLVQARDDYVVAIFSTYQAAAEFAGTDRVYAIVKRFVDVL